jgi:hypothetical protein
MVTDRNDLVPLERIRVDGGTQTRAAARQALRGPLRPRRPDPRRSDNP